MITKILLLLLPAIAYGRVQIKIITAPNENYTSISTIGSIVDIISDEERETFKIQNVTLKDAVRIYSKETPLHVFVKSPTPWGDLYKSYAWNQVERVLHPLKAKIVSVKTESVLISSEEFINNSTVKITYSGNVNHEIEDTFSSSWTKDGKLSVGQDINYNIGLGSTKNGGSNYLEFSSKWGEGTRRSKVLPLGSFSKLDLVLEPGQMILTTLNATRTTMKVEIDYVAVLKGDIACNYKSKFDGHHFWGYDINSVLKAANLTNKVFSTEIISIEYFSNAVSFVKDMDS